MCSTMVSVTTVWASGDIALGLMTWVNLIVIVVLAKPALNALKDFDRQYKQGLDPVFDPDSLGIKNADIWHKINPKTKKTQDGGESVC